MRRPTLRFLLFALLTATGGAVAQPSFVDVPDGHWAGGAVERIADLGIVIGHPDGTFRGDDAFTRYQAALVVSRLLAVIDQNIGAMAAMTDDDIALLRDAMNGFADELAALDARVASLESAGTGETDAVRVAELERRVETLSAEVQRLREALAEVRPTPGLVGPRGPERPPGSNGSEGPRGPAGAPGEGGAAGPVPEPEREAAPSAEAGAEKGGDASDGRPGVAPTAPRAERRPAYLGFAAVSESNDRVPVRVMVGYDELLGPFGLRATIDYGRQSPSDARAVTIAAHLTYAYPLGAGRVRGYLGAGGGVQFDAADSGQAAEGAFVGGLLGLEVGLVGPTAAFVEGMVDAYVNEPADAPGYAYGRLYPTLAAGIAVRF